MMKDITDYFSSPSKVSIEERPKRNKKKIRRKPTRPAMKDVETELSSNPSLIGDITSGSSKKLNDPSSLAENSKKGKRSSLLENTEQYSSPVKSKTYKSTSNGGSSGTIQNIDCPVGKPVKAYKLKSPQNSKEATNDRNKVNLKTSSGLAESDDAKPMSATMKDTPKVNAFQFMMDSRNIIIGENSNGKIASEQESITSGSKPKLDTRKELFKHWADKKGALKRQREEEEVEKCINLKLERRAKRLKKLIQGKTEEKKETVKMKEPNTQPKRMKKKKIVEMFHSSDSEDSTALPGNESTREPKSCSPQLVRISEVIEENAQDAVLTISSPPAKKQHVRENCQNNLLNFFGILSKDAKEERIEVFDDTSKQPSKELIKIKMFTKMVQKRRPLPLNRDLTNSMTDESSQESVKGKKWKKKKKKMKDKYERLPSDVQLNDSLEDFCSPEATEAKKINTSLEKNKKHKLIKNNHDNDKKKCNSLKSKPILEDQVYQRNTDTKSTVDRTDRCASVKRMSNKRPIDELLKKDMLEEVESKGSHEYSNNKTVEVMYDSECGSDIIVSKKNQSIKRCLISDDSDSSTSAMGPNDKSIADLPITKSKLKCIVKYNLGDAKSSVDDCLLKGSDIQDTELPRKKMKIRDDNFEDSCQNFSDMAANTRRSSRKSSEIQILKNEDVVKSNDIELQGRVLRPKRNNLNYSDLFKDKTPKSPKANKKEKLSKKPSGTSSNKNESIEEISSDSDYEEATKEKGPVKVAPVFLKATPKPKLNPEVVEARKKFLMSGVPDSLKKTIEKQKSIEEKEYDIFPNISHIQQKCENTFWDLPKPDIKYTPITPFNPDEQYLIFRDLIVRNPTYEVNITTENKKINHVKNLLDKIKVENSNYPVYKVFRHIYEKSGKNYVKEPLKRKKSLKRRSKSSVSIEPPSTSDDKAYKMWSEKYKPRCSEEILGNHSGVKALKTWLEIWMNYSEEINSRGKRKMTNSNSESEFESTDCDSRDSTRLPGNTMILGGPCGSGKTSAVYAIANELGFNVLELNASSKRTGKRLVQELQEATQSHQVRKNENKALATFINSDKTTNNARKTKMDKEPEQYEASEQNNKKKMCILLIEDIDLVFDQDDGFLTSLGQLITTSKRPIILTTTDNSPVHVQKLLSQNEYISFMPLSLQCLNVWLQIVCLVEGLFVDKDDLGSLLEYNGGDIRKTLLEVQFWTQGGGQLEQRRTLPLKSNESRSSGNCRFKASDEALKFDLSEDHDPENYFVHKHCIESFEVLRENKEYSVPQSVSLGTLWWNIPNIFNIPSCALERLHRQKVEKSEEATPEPTIDSNEKDEIQLDSVQSFYDALILTDSLFKSINYHNSHEPVVRNWMTGVRDSIELTERTEDHELCLDMVRDLTHTLVNGSIENYNRIDETECNLNMALPDGRERRWRAKQHMSEDFLKEPIPLLNALDRPSLALDYLPALRGIARCEEQRAASNTKRGNRFRHYLKNLNMDFKEGTCKIACNMLNATA